MKLEKILIACAVLLLFGDPVAAEDKNQEQQSDLWPKPKSSPPTP